MNKNKISLGEKRLKKMERDIEDREKAERGGIQKSRGGKNLGETPVVRKKKPKKCWMKFRKR